MAKRIKLAETDSLSAPASSCAPSTDLTKCIVCQEETNERLECPAASKRKDAGAGYKSFTENLLRFSDIAEIPGRISLERLNDGIGIESTLCSRKASWHKSCRCKFNTTKLERAEKRKSSQYQESDLGEAKYTRSKKGTDIDIKVACLFCDQPIKNEESRDAMTIRVDRRARDCALLLEDKSLLAKLSAGDMVAQEAKYHPKCLAGLYNRVRGLERMEKSAMSDKDMSHSIALAELVSYIEESRFDSSVAPVFQLSDLVSLYTSRLRQLGLDVEKRMHSTKLKDRILALIPGLKAHPQGKQVMLAFESDICHALGAACEKNYDSDAMVLAKAATIIRRDLFDLIETKTEFSGSFDINCQNSSVPASLMGLVRMIHEGPNIKDQFTQPNSALAVSQLIAFNTVKRK